MLRNFVIAAITVVACAAIYWLGTWVSKHNVYIQEKRERLASYGWLTCTEPPEKANDIDDGSCCYLVTCTTEDGRKMKVYMHSIKLLRSADASENCRFTLNCDWLGYIYAPEIIKSVKPTDVITEH